MILSLSTSSVAMASLYILAGINHFINPGFYLKITPKWVPKPILINLVVGGFEILLGLGLLFSSLQRISAMGIIALLIAVFPANVYHYQKSRKKGKNVLLTLVRLPIQALLIYWAYQFI